MDSHEGCRGPPVVEGTGSTSSRDPRPRRTTSHRSVTAFGVAGTLARWRIEHCLECRSAAYWSVRSVSRSRSVDLELGLLELQRPGILADGPHPVLGESSA